MSSSDFQPGRLAARHREGPRGQVIDFEVAPDWAAAHRVPGQYCAIRWPDEVGYFALANAPGTGRLSFYVQDNGGVSTALLAAPVGARVPIGRPSGAGYGLEPLLQDDGPVYALATGSGWFGLSTALDLIAAHRPLTAFVGFRQRVDVIGAATHRDLEARGCTVRVCLSRAEADWDGDRGYVQSVFAGAVSDLSTAWVLACGHPEMQEAARALCLERGLDPERFLTNY